MWTSLVMGVMRLPPGIATDVCNAVTWTSARLASLVSFRGNPMTTVTVVSAFYKFASFKLIVLNRDIVQ